MPWVVNIGSVPWADIACAIVKISVMVIEDMKSTYPNNTTVVVSNLDSTRSRNTTVFIIIDRHIFDLDDGTVIIVLYIGFIIVPRIKRNTHTWGIEAYI